MKQCSPTTACLRSIRLKGLDPDAFYRVDGFDEPLEGDELMYSGVMAPHQSGDFFSVIGLLRKVT
ncbi:GH36 C-terminal domain-containing protein [Paenibacillus oralis]|uniref:GH36 C-terminal domain-containing protein n=1 Tax=Paenibacillus oralis TaxID=2490856 RepID=UPI001FE9BD2F|nr:GH36 C-terminal domain-containing protein [Paenibacillus oralis]